MVRAPKFSVDARGNGEGEGEGGKLVGVCRLAYEIRHSNSIRPRFRVKKCPVRPSLNWVVKLCPLHDPLVLPLPATKPWNVLDKDRGHSEPAGHRRMQQHVLTPSGTA